MMPDFNAGGWCPNCAMRSVTATPDRLICTSMQCRWSVVRTQVMEERVLNGPPELRDDLLHRFKES